MKAIVLLNHKNRELKVVEEFTDSTIAHDYCIEFIEQYIQSHQGDRPFEYCKEPPADLKYGFFVRPSKSILFKWSIIEVVRDVGYVYNSYEYKKHLTISIASHDTQPNDELSDEEHWEVSPVSLEQYDEVVELLRRRFNATHSVESSDSDDSE